MTLLALRIVEPAHQLTISGCDFGKVGSCRCGWSYTGQVSSDDVTRFYMRHLKRAGAVHATCCDRCQRGLASIRRASYELCAACAHAEDVAEARAAEQALVAG